VRRISFPSRAQRVLRLLGAALGRPLIGPQLVTLEITHHCNLHCGFCESHGCHMGAPLTARRTYAGDRRAMSVETVAALSRSLARLGIGRVDLSGKGDPIAHPRLSEIVRTIRAAGLECSLFTNGTLAQPDLAATLVMCGISQLNLSLNAGSREVYARVAGKDLWERAIGFLRDVIEQRRRAGVSHPRVRVSYVVCRENVADLDRAVALCCELGLDEIGLTVMGELPETAHLQLGTAEVADVLARIPGWSRKLDAAGIGHDLARLAEELPLRVGAGGRQQENPLQRELPCYEGWMFSVVGPDGAVAPCCYCEGVPLGNVVEEDYARIWSGPRYADFRRRSLALPRSGAPICWECFTTCNRAVDNQRVHRRVRQLRPW
jgi:MoaA/NifB/PqqE/SkfB family radical SAM enzyme